MEDDKNSYPYALVLVMPVYNEGDRIVEVVQSWFDELSKLKINFLMIVINDGSNDGTEDALKLFEDQERIRVIHQTNSGHGPTILVGYHMAVDMAYWTFQVDSDDEMKATHFGRLWEKRSQFDMVIGYRVGRRQSLERNLITRVARGVITGLFGKGIDDVNVPYRLIRSERLKKMITYISPNTFAPNLIISGVANRSGLKIYNIPIPYEEQKDRKTSLIKWRLWRGAFKAFYQTLFAVFRVRVNRNER